MLNTHATPTTTRTHASASGGAGLYLATPGRLSSKSAPRCNSRVKHEERMPMDSCSTYEVTDLGVDATLRAVSRRSVLSLHLLRNCDHQALVISICSVTEGTTVLRASISSSVNEPLGARARAVYNTATVGQRPVFRMQEDHIRCLVVARAGAIFCVGGKEEEE